MYMDKKHGTYQHPNSSNRGQGNRKSWPRMNPRNHRRTGSSAHLDNDGDTDMSGERGGYSNRGKNKSRYTPGYKGRPNKSHNLHAGGWWKIVVYDADKFEKDHFFKMLDNTTNECIDPQAIHVSHNKMIFWIKNGRAAEAIKNQSGKLTLKDHTINLFTVASNGPETVLSKDEHKAKICNALIKRYKDNVLNLSEFHKDVDLKNIRSRLYETAPILGELIQEKCADLVHEIDFSCNNLNSISCLRSILTASKCLTRIKFENNYLKKIHELQPLKNHAPNITHLSLVNNPVKNIMDEAQYISDIRKLFPKLIHLDNVPLPEKIKFDADEPDVLLPPTQTFSILLEPTQKSAVQNFFLQYVKIFDSAPERRVDLAPAYDDTCLFSCATSWRSKGEVSAKFPTKMPGDLIKRNRNFKHCARAELKESRLFIGRDSVLKELCELEPTRHVLHTLNIDTGMLINGHITAILSGFIDTANNYRTFSRTFILASAPNGSLLILNDQLSVVRSNPEMAKKIESPDLTTPAPAPGPAGVAPATALSDQAKAELVARVRAATKMIDEYCRLCLDAGGWDYDRAMAVFRDTHSKGTIPAHVFIT